VKGEGSEGVEIQQRESMAKAHIPGRLVNWKECDRNGTRLGCFAASAFYLLYIL
jgi:hypothetical protein